MITSDPSLCNKSLRARNKVAHVELLRGFARPVLRYSVTVTYRNQQRRTQKRFSVFRKKRAKLKTKDITTTFGKSLFLTKHRIRYAIYMPPNTKVLLNKPNNGCRRKTAKRNDVRTSKQLRFVAITERFNGNQAISSWLRRIWENCSFYLELNPIHRDESQQP